MISKVKWFNSEKGFGFIALNESVDAFVYFEDIIESGFKDLEAGNMVDFKLEKTEKGYAAKEVKKLENVNY